MAIRCESCGEQNRDGAQLCEFCKTLFVRRPPPLPPPPVTAAPALPPPARGWSTSFVALVAVTSLGLGVGVGRVLAPAPQVQAMPRVEDAGLVEVAEATPTEVEPPARDAEVHDVAVVEPPDAGPPPETPRPLVEVAVDAGVAPVPGALAEHRVFVVPYEPYEGSARRIIIPVTFKGTVKARLLLDTGAPGTVIFPSLANRLGVLETNEGRLLTVASGIGGERSAMLVVLDSLCVQEACTEFVPATVVDQMSGAFEGLVGMDFLGGYQIDIDTSHHVLTLTELQRPDSPGGHDERWWRGTFAWFEREKQRWSSVHTMLQGRVERVESLPGMSLDQTRQLMDFSATQTRQIETLCGRLERHASFNSVPREWRRP